MHFSVFFNYYYFSWELNPSSRCGEEAGCLLLCVRRVQPREKRVTARDRDLSLELWISMAVRLSTWFLSHGYGGPNCKHTNARLPCPSSHRLLPASCKMRQRNPRFAFTSISLSLIFFMHMYTYILLNSWFDNCSFLNLKVIIICLT